MNTMSPRLSKLVLTSHIAFSVGWFGAVSVFLVLAITGVFSQNIQLVRSAYIIMELSGWFIIVPFCFASLITGIVQALGTKYGLFKHYWIIVKLILTVLATVLLLLHMNPISYMAGLAEKTSFLNSEEVRLRIQLIADAGAAVVLLLATTTISIYKPWGKIKYTEKSTLIQEKIIGRKRSLKLYLIIGFFCLFIIFIIKHLSSGMIHH